MMNVDGTGVVNLTDNNPTTDSSPRNGTTLAFESDRDGDNEIYLMNIDGTNQ